MSDVERLSLWFKIGRSTLDVARSFLKEDEAPMLFNYIKIAFRNIARHKVYSLINILGLAIGIAAVILIFLYIDLEYSFDNFHRNNDRIFRVSFKMYRNKIFEGDTYVFVPPVGPAIKSDIPEVEEYTRISTARSPYLIYSDKVFKVDNLVYADSTFFNLFDFEFFLGDRGKALTSPDSIVLTKETAEKFFGDKNPVGEIIHDNDNHAFTVTGVTDNPPLNSHIQFNALVSFSTLYENPDNHMGWNGGNQYITYVLLKKNVIPSTVEAKLPDLMWKNLNESLSALNISFEAYFQPLEDIHLYYNEDSMSIKTNVYIFITIAIFILFIACINFINLTTARSTKRAKEIGIRKVLGAHKKALIIQFLSESVLLSLFALAIALVFVELAMPEYNELIERQIRIADSFGFSLILGLAALLVITGVFAGLYPAVRLSSFQPTKTLKGETAAGRPRVTLRNILVIVQFALSISLISATFLINLQLNYLKGKDPGFDKENIIVLPLINDEMQIHAKEIKNELSKIPKVVSLTASSEVPSSGFTVNGYALEGFTTPMMINVVDVDEDYLKTFNLKIVQGRAFNDEISTDKDNYLINETLAHQASWTDPIGKMIARDGRHQVIGVVKDFNFATLHEKIEPLIITNQPWRDRFSLISVKITGGNTKETLNRIEKVWHKFAEDCPFEYSFLDESFDQIYKSEIKFKQIFFYFSAFAIFIALLGLFGLAAYTIEQRTKEIGIRKILGASFSEIIAMLTRGFLMPVVIANLIAIPVTCWFINNWLENFAYRIDMSWWTFLGAACISMLIALITVAYHAVKAALTDPVKALRYE